MTATRSSPVSCSVSLADEERTRGVIAESLLGSWDVVNILTRPRPSRAVACQRPGDFS